MTANVIAAVGTAILAGLMAALTAMWFIEGNYAVAVLTMVAMAIDCLACGMNISQAINIHDGKL